MLGKLTIPLNRYKLVTRRDGIFFKIAKQIKTIHNNTFRPSPSYFIFNHLIISNKHWRGPYHTRRGNDTTYTHIRYTRFLAGPNKLFLTYQQPSDNKHSLTNMHQPHERKKQRNIQKNFQMSPPNYLQGLSKMDVKYQTWNFFSAKLSTHFFTS